MDKERKPHWLQQGSHIDSLPKQPELPPNSSPPQLKLPDDAREFLDQKRSKKRKRAIINRQLTEKAND
jgi:hypothetical protein